jgi:hypothetical protein
MESLVYECQKSYNDSMVVTHYDSAGDKELQARVEEPTQRPASSTNKALSAKAAI